MKQQAAENSIDSKAADSYGKAESGDEGEWIWHGMKKREQE